MSHMLEGSLHEDIEEFRFHFDAMYVGGIPRLLNEDGAFLAFLAILTATDSLAGVFAPNLKTGVRFKEFVGRFYPEPLRGMVGELWKFRNLMVHAFNPDPFALVCHQSRLHLTAQNGLMVLNAEDFYATLISASHGYFDALIKDADLQVKFALRLAEDDGGGIQSFNAQRTNPTVESV